MTGHGSFRSYIKRIGKTPSDACPSCGKTDDPEHTRNIQIEIEVEIHARNVIDLMLRNEEHWNAISKFI